MLANEASNDFVIYYNGQSHISNRDVNLIIKLWHGKNCLEIEYTLDNATDEKESLLLDYNQVLQSLPLKNTPNSELTSQEWIQRQVVEHLIPQLKLSSSVGHNPQQVQLYIEKISSPKNDQFVIRDDVTETSTNNGDAGVVSSENKPNLFKASFSSVSPKNHHQPAFYHLSSTDATTTITDTTSSSRQILWSSPNGKDEQQDVTTTCTSNKHHQRHQQVDNESVSSKSILTSPSHRLRSRISPLRSSLSNNNNRGHNGNNNNNNHPHKSLQGGHLLPSLSLSPSNSIIIHSQHSVSNERVMTANEAQRIGRRLLNPSLLTVTTPLQSNQHNNSARIDSGNGSSSKKSNNNSNTTMNYFAYPQLLPSSPATTAPLNSKKLTGVRTYQPSNINQSSSNNSIVTSDSKKGSIGKVVDKGGGRRRRNDPEDILKASFSSPFIMSSAASLASDNNSQQDQSTMQQSSNHLRQSPTRSSMGSFSLIPLPKIISPSKDSNSKKGNIIDGSSITEQQQLSLVADNDNEEEDDDITDFGSMANILRSNEEGMVTSLIPPLSTSFLSTSFSWQLQQKDNSNNNNNNHSNNNNRNNTYSTAIADAVAALSITKSSRQLDYEHYQEQSRSYQSPAEKGVDDNDFIWVPVDSLLEDVGVDPTDADGKQVMATRPLTSKAELLQHHQELVDQIVVDAMNTLPSTSPSKFATHMMMNNNLSLKVPIPLPTGGTVAVPSITTTAAIHNDHHLELFTDGSEHTEGGGNDLVLHDYTISSSTYSNSEKMLFLFDDHYRSERQQPQQQCQKQQQQQEPFLSYLPEEQEGSGEVTVILNGGPNTVDSGAGESSATSFSFGQQHHHHSHGNIHSIII